MVLAVLAGAGCHRAPGPPRIDTPIVATLVGGPVRIDGSDFGDRGSDRSVVVGTTRIVATDASVTTWADQTVIFNLPPNAPSGTVALQTPQGTSAKIPLEVYAYDAFPIPGTNVFPLAVAVDSLHRVWVSSEFHFDIFHVLDPASGAFTVLSIPKPVDPGPFATRLLNTDQRTQMSELGEDILVDDRGRIWLTEGGGLLYERRPDGSGQNPNHSRIVCYDPAAPPNAGFRVYAIPGDRNEVIGMAWDARQGRLWFAQGGREAGARLWSFDPEKLPYDTQSPTFDFSTSLDSLIGPAGYQVHVLPSPTMYSGHLALDPDGHVWFTGYLKNVIGRLDPAAGTVEEFPLPARIGLDPASTHFNTSGSWQILLAPDGSVVWNEQFDSRIGRLDAARVRAGDPACRALDGAGKNPCAKLLDVPGADLATQLLHSIAFDARGRLWYTQHGPRVAGGTASLGFATGDWSSVVRLPPLPHGAGDGPLANDGLAIDGSTGDIWFAEYFAQRIGRLRLR